MRPRVEWGLRTGRTGARVKDKRIVHKFYAFVSRLVARVINLDAIALCRAVLACFGSASGARRRYGS